ncbi:MAG: prepilin-type N-terminal cleavage/methylation domain-containing protein [Magnetococcales bacterium]|nr:prepilin-type N-terminal cleavage/methylation domain-containing protein [Magnetococcales bacterium]
MALKLPSDDAPLNAAGFTLIELIIIIVVFGILAVTITPHYLDISSDAELANSQKIHGDIKSLMQNTFALHRSRSLTGSGTGDETYITNCNDLSTNYLTDLGGVTCTGTQLTFPNAQSATLIPETNTRTATLTNLSGG